MMWEMGRGGAVSRVHLEEEDDDTLGDRPTDPLPLSVRPSAVSACGLLGGRKTKKLFGRRIWRATDECLAADEDDDDDGK